MRTPAQELPVAVTTASNVALEDKVLQPLSQGALNEESGIAIQYLNGKLSSVVFDANSSSNEKDTASTEKSISSNESRSSNEKDTASTEKSISSNQRIKKVDSAPLETSKEKLCTKVLQTRNTRTAYSLRKAPKKKVFK